ncbi:MAG: hypothetical protein HXY34_12835 [Candidatus Thorarchaeota archaeon]|nr:hypothetical protein [Candidatus Thorarchaeota archaeon]
MSITFDVLVFGSIILILVAFFSGPVVFIWRAHHEPNNRLIRFFFGSGRRAIITVAVMYHAAFLWPALLLLPLSLSDFWLACLLAGQFPAFLTIWYAVMYIPFRIGPFSFAMRDVSVMMWLERLHKRGKLDDDSLRRGLRVILGSAQRGNTRSRRVLEDTRSRTDEFGERVNSILTLLEE